MVPLSFSSSKTIGIFFVVVIILVVFFSVVETATGAMLFAIFYTTFFSLFLHSALHTFEWFCVFVHAFWQWHKMELSLVKINVAVTMYSLETTFHVMVQICFILYFFLRPSLSYRSHFAFSALFFLTLQNILPDQISQIKYVFLFLLANYKNVSQNITFNTHTHARALVIFLYVNLSRKFI